MKTDCQPARTFMRAHLPHSALSKQHLAKGRQPKQIIRTEFHEAEELVASESEIRQTEARRSALELKFRELKKESLNVLLTDTLSILKIQPADKALDSAEPKRCSLKVRKEHLPTEPPPREAPRTASDSPSKDSVNLRKFRQSKSGGNRRKESSLSSVFYYFPVL